MSGLFLRIMNMSISASWLVLAVLLLRFALKKAPRWLGVLLWGIVALRLICPISIESALSLIPSAETIPMNIEMDATPAIDSGINAINRVVNPMISASFTPAPMTSANPLQILIPLAAVLWIGGMAAMLLYTTVSYWRLRRKVREAVIFRDNIYQSEYVASPFVLGIIRPKIYLPYKMRGQDLVHVVAHEQAHIRRRDHWWKPFGFLLLTVHWFNPLMWLAYVLLCRDIELACDEKVIKELGSEQRADYSQALVACSVGRRAIAACPLAFGEVGVKERVKSVMNYKKPAFWIILAAVIACAVAAVCFLTDPVSPQDSLELIERDTPSGANAVKYSANLGKQVKGGLIYAEQWSNGECVRSSPVVLTQTVEEIYVRTDVRKEAGTSVGVDIQIDTDGRGGSLITYFSFPEADAFYGWSFTAREKNDKVTVAPAEDIILAAMAFDAGNGVRAFDCQSLESEPERLENTDYMIVIRACFDDVMMQVNQPYGVVEVSYESPLTSFSMVAQVNTPSYRVDENGHLFSVLEHSDAPNWTDLGKLSELTISKENFDNLFRNNSGDGWLTRQSASEIRRNTAKAWSVIYDQDRLYYLLQQKNGELYLAYGYYDYSEKDDPYSDDTNIRWLYKLARSDAGDGADLISVFQRQVNDSSAAVTDWVYAEDGAYGLRGIVQYTDSTNEVWKLAFIRNDVAHCASQVWNSDYVIAGPLSYLGKGTVSVRVKNTVDGTLYDGIMSFSYDEEDNHTHFKAETQEVLLVQNNTVTEIGRGTLKAAVELTDEDAAGLLRLIESGSWEDGIPDCSSDCAINLGGRQFCYCSECGTLMKYDLSKLSILSHTKDHSGQHWKLTAADRIAVNNLLCGYVELLYGITDIPGAEGSDDTEDPLHTAITSAILAQNKPSNPDGLFHCANFALLGQEALCFDSDPPMPMQVTVYGIALHQAYGFSGHSFHEAGGSHIPTAITFEVVDGEYILKEYWIPRDGADYGPDIREKFPDDIEDAAMDTQRYIFRQIQDCYEQAVRFGKVDTDDAVEYLFEVMESSPLYSSRPGDYIDAHPIAYRELTYYGNYTLQYIFSRFLEGGQTGLRGHLMRVVLDALAPEAQLRLYAETGQAYFDAWKAGAVRISEQHDMDWIKEKQPAVYLLLQMMNE